MDVGFQASIDYGGQGRYAIELVRELAEYIDTLTVYPSVKSIEDPAGHDWWNGIPGNVHIEERGALWRERTRALREHDLVHINYASLGLPATLTEVLHDVPYVYTMHGPPTMAVAGGIQSTLEYLVELKLSLKPVISRGVVATPSESNRRLLQTKFDTEAAVIPHGCHRLDATVSEEETRARYSIREDAEILLFVGRFHEYKDIPTLLDSYALVEDRYDGNLCLVMVGGGKKELEVTRQARDRDIRPRIIDDVTDETLQFFYNEASLLLFPSYAEGFGLVLLEAMAEGLPVVCSDLGASEEVVGDAGLVAEAGIPESFAEKTLTLLRDPDLAAELGRRSVERARTFTWSDAARQYASLYRDAVEAG